jgi:ubiquitin-protein ligase
MSMKRLAKEAALLDPAIELTETIPEPQTYDRAVLWTLRIPPQDPLPAYTVQFTFPKLYPFREPAIRIPEPPNILDGLCCCHSSDGNLCVSGFLDAWGPHWTINNILYKIRRLLVEKEDSAASPKTLTIPD